MSDHFDPRKDCPSLRRATRAYVEILLEDLLPAVRLAARGCGYCIAVHGSLSRDIDLLAVPWTANASEPKVLVDRLCGAIASVVGRALPSKDWADKPHGRKAIIILTTGEAEIDLSIMPRITPSKPEGEADE